MNLQNVPAEMKALKQWACYKTYYDAKRKKQVKNIYSAITGRYAKCNDASTWSDYETAVRYYRKNRLHGLAFALKEGIVFIDIDHAVEKDRIISPEARELMEIFSGSYIERSCSGKGVHILTKGVLPVNAMHKNDKKGLEMYDSHRFVCLTGDLLGTSTNLADAHAVIGALNEHYIGKRPQLKLQVHQAQRFEDDRLIEIISRSRQGSKFDALMRGEQHSYASHSSADFALVSILAFWTQDKAQIDRIFRQSGLMREKWDRRTGATTYGERTIENALRMQTRRFQSEM